MKKIFLGLGSMVYGFISLYWILFASLAMFPETSPGDKDYGEDVWFAPVGWGMAIIWVAFTVWCLWMLKRKKCNILACILCSFVSAGIGYFAI